MPLQDANAGTITIIFEAQDNVSSISKQVENSILGIDATVNKTISKPLTYLETEGSLLETNEGLKELNEQFKLAMNDIDTEIAKTTEQVWEFEDATSESWTRAGILAGGVAAAVGLIYQNLNDVVVLAEERPELFTDEEISQVEEYSQQVQELRDEWLQLKVDVGTAVLPGVIELLNRSNDTGRAMELAAAAGENWAFISEQQKNKFIELADQEQNAIRETESFDRAMTDFGETVVRAGDSTKQASDEMAIGLSNVNEPMQRTLDLMAEIAAYNGQIINFGVNFQTYGAISVPGTGLSTSQSDTRRGRSTNSSLNFLTQEVNRRSLQ